MDKLSQYIVVYLFIFFVFHASDLKRVHVWMTLYIEAESNDNFAIFSVATGTLFFRWLANLFWHCRQLSLVSFTLDFALARLLPIHFLFHIFLWNSSFCGLHGSIFVVWRLYDHNNFVEKTVFFIGDSVEKKMSFFIGYLTFFRCRFAISYGNSSIFLSSNV